MKATSLIAAALLAAGTTVYAQEPPATQEVRPQVTPPPLPVRFPPVQPAESALRASASRTDIKQMETLLTNALQKGAQDLAMRMQANEPGSRFVTGTGRARGFALEGYGVFFDVDVPGMRQSLVWSSEMLRQAQQADYLRQYIAANPGSPARGLAEMDLSRIERQMNAVRAPQQPSAAQGLVRATVDLESIAPTPPLPPDPNELYTDAVKNALIDSMLKYSGFLKIGADEWLTVAARDSEGPPIPGQIDDASTIVISIKGSDLAAFQSNKLTFEEVKKKVAVKEF
ncbi:MAG TPA: hypothetical protein VF921_18995 [Vicinamibacterales bacterium]